MHSHQGQRHALRITGSPQSLALLLPSQTALPR